MKSNIERIADALEGLLALQKVKMGVLPGSIEEKVKRRDAISYVDDFLQFKRDLAVDLYREREGIELDDANEIPRVPGAKAPF